MSSSTKLSLEDADRIIAIDGKDFLRTSPTSQFRGVLGVAVTFADPGSFLEAYGEIIAKLKSKYDLKSKLNVLKSFRIMTSLGKTLGETFLEEYYTEVSDFISDLTIFYTTIPSTKIPEIKKYGEDRGGIQKIPPVEFLKELQSSYPHCCAWKYHKTYGSKSNDKLLLDFFQGEVTKAWLELSSKSNIIVSTDETSPFVATADIITKLIDNRLFSKRGKLYSRDIESCFPNDGVKVNFLDELDYIVPIRREKINVEPFIVRPIIFILKEGVEKEVVGGIQERKIIERSPAMSSIINFTIEKGTYFKFFDASTDEELIREGDYFVYFGEKGKRTAEYFIKLGYNITSLDVDDLKKE